MKPLLELPFNPTSTDPFSSNNRGVVPSFSRDSIGQSEDEQGNLVIVGRQSFRWKKSGTKFYLTIEPATINLIPYISENFSRWAADTGVVVYAKTQTGPTADYDADELVLNSSSSEGISSTTATTATSKTVTFSIWIRTASGTKSMQLAIVSVGGEDGPTTASITATTTWTRYSVTKIFTGLATGFIRAYVWNNTLVSDTVYLWGAQIEELLIPTTYLPTTPVFTYNQNLIADGDMELGGVSDWPGYGTFVSISKSSSIVKFGRQSIKVVVGAISSGIQQAVTTVNGAYYKLSGWFYSVDITNVGMLVAGSGGDNTVSMGVWSYLEYIFKALSTSTIIGINATSSGTFYADKIVLVRQLCPEPSFESSFTTSPPAPWAVTGTPTVSKETSLAHSSVNSIKLTCDAVEGIKITQADITLEVSTWYRYSAWIYIVSQSGASIVPQMVLDDHLNGNVSFTQKGKSTIGVWQKIEIIAKTHSSITSTKALSFVQSAAGTLVFLVDDVSIVKLEDPVVLRIADVLALPLVNSQRSNFLKYSSEFSNAVWTNVTSTVTSDDAVAPDGSSTADRISFTGAGSVYQILSTPVQASTSYVFSVWIRSRTGTKAVGTYILINDGYSLIYQPVVSTNKWRRYFVSYTTGASPTQILCGIENISISCDIWAWGAQLEIGSYPSPYTPTTSAIQNKVFTNYASSNFSKRQGSFSFWAIVPAIPLTQIFGEFSSTPLYIAQGSAGQPWIISIEGLSKAGALVDKAPSATSATSALSSTAEHFIALAWSEERDSSGKLVLLRVKLWVNGAIEINQTYTDIQEWNPVLSSLGFGNGAALASIRDLKIWPAPLKDDEVTSMYVAG